MCCFRCTILCFLLELERKNHVFYSVYKVVSFQTLTLQRVHLQVHPYAYSSLIIYGLSARLK